MRMARVWQLLMVAAVAAGVLLRAVQYFADSSLWVDEAALSRNILDRSFAQLAQPLDYAQSAPIGFLFAQKVMVTFGGSELLLRAIPFAASLTALVVFAVLVRRVLTDFGQAMAVTAFALGCPFIYFAAQAKPYSTDVTVTLLLTWLLLRGIEKSRSIAYWIVCGVIAVAGCAVSHAATLMVSAHGVVLGWCYWRGQAPLSRAQFVAVQALWIAGVALSVWLSLGSISAPDLAYFARDPLRVVRAGPSDGRRRVVADAPDGGRVWHAAVCAAATRWRIAIRGALAVRHCRCRWLRCSVDAATTVAFVLLLPILAAVAASALRMYPLGGRHTVFLLPLLIVAAAAGWEFITVRCASAQAFTPSGWCGERRCCFWPRHSPRSPEIFRPSTSNTFGPAAEYVRQHWQPGDSLYVYYGAGQAFRYYAPRVGLADSGYRLGRCARGEPIRYLRELDEFRGRRRVWSLFTHATANGAELTLLA